MSHNRVFEKNAPKINNIIKQLCVLSLKEWSEQINKYQKINRIPYIKYTISQAVYRFLDTIYFLHITFI